MSFFLGLVSGAAGAIDKQLQKDMQRTEDRLYEMETYRVTRGRAATERKEKEKKELKDTLNELATFTGGDEEKAIQLYVKGGKTIEGAKALAKTFKANQEAGKDINALVKYVDAADPRDFETFVNSNVSRVERMPVSKDEMKASGLYGALFNPDFGGELRKRVDAKVDFDEPVTTTDKKPARMADIDYTKMLSAEEAAFKKKERQLVFDRFKLDEKKFDLLSTETKDKMRLAQEAQTLSEKIAKSDMSEQAKASAREDARLKMDEAKLRIAQDEAGLRSTQIMQQMQLTDVKIDTAAFELEKLENAPEFATHEAMLVAADNALARLQVKDAASLTEEDKLEIEQMTQLRNTALESMKAAAQAEATSTYTPAYSKESVSSIIKNSVNLSMKQVGLFDSLTESIAGMTDGNAIDHLTAQHRGLKNAAAANVNNDKVFSSVLAGNRADLNAELQNWAKKQYTAYTEAQTEPDFDAANYNITEDNVITAYVNSQSGMSPKEAMNKFAEENNLTKGHLIKKGDKFLMWTGSQFIGV